MKKILIILIIGLILLNGCGTTQEQTNKDASTLDLEKNQESKIEEPKTIEEQIKEDVKSKAGRDTIKDISVYGEKDIVINIDLKYEGGWSSETLKSGAIQDASSVMKELFTKYPEINRVSIFSHFLMIDNYGNEEYKKGLKFMMDKETADKVNWDNVYFIDFTKVLDDYRELINF